MSSVRRLVSDSKDDVLVLRDSRQVERLCGVESVNASVLPEPPIDGAWCPLKEGSVNSSFIATCSVAPVMMFDADGDVRGSYLAMDANDKVVHAQSVCWRKCDPTSIVGGYGAQEAPVLCGFDIQRSEVSWVLASSKVPPPMGTGSGKPGLVTTVTEFGQSSMLCYGTTLGDMFGFDIRSLCVSMVFGRGTCLGRAHQKGVSSTLSIEESYQILSIPRSGESNVFLWDTRNTAVPLDCVNRGAYDRHQYGGPAMSAKGSIIIPGASGLKVLRIVGGHISSVDVSAEVLGSAVCVSGNGAHIQKDATVGPIASIQGGNKLLFTTGVASRPIPSGARNVRPLSSSVAESDSDVVAVPAVTKVTANVVEFSDSDDEQVASSSVESRTQLQQKRRDKAQKQTGDYETFDQFVPDTASGENTQQPNGEGIVEYSADKGGVKSVFAKDTKAELELRRKAQYAPLLDRDFMKGGGGSSGIEFGQWFKIATLGGINDSPSSTLQPKYVGEGDSKVMIARGPHTATFPYSIALPTRASLVSCELPVVEDETASEATSKDDGPIGLERALFTEWMRRIDTKFGTGIRNDSPLAGLEVNQFERNIEVWRQMWRTVEQGDVVLIVADARYPIIHLPASLLVFVFAVCKKRAVIVLNKVDLVPETRLVQWETFVPQYAQAVLAKHNVVLGPNDMRVCRFTSNPAAETTTAKEGEAIDKRRKHKQNRNAKRYAQFKQANRDGSSDESSEEEVDQTLSTFGAGAQFKGMEKAARELHKDDRTFGEIDAVGRMVGKLFSACREIAPLVPQEAPKSKDPTAPHHGLEGFLSIGLIGHPNVGKSNLVNCLRGRKVVSVSSSAGHTKHLQHIPLKDERITLIDCPGLAFPVLGVPRPMQAVIGTHQIAQTRDPQSAVAYLASRIPLETVYALKKIGGDDEDPWSAYELCESYATKRGYHVKRGKGAVDTQRAAISIITDAYEGRLVLSFQAPPAEFLTSKAFLNSISPLLFSEIF